MSTVINIRKEETLSEDVRNCWANTFEQSMEENPNMELNCLYCGKRFKPYDHNVNHGYVFMSFCNENCFRKYHSWKGKIKRVIVWIIWIIRNHIIG